MDSQDTDTQDPRNQSPRPADKIDLEALYYQNVRTLPRLTDAEVAVSARQVRHGQGARQRLKRVRLSSPDDADRLVHQAQAGEVSYERIADEWPWVAALVKRYATRCGVAWPDALRQVARKVRLLAERIKQGERARQKLIEGNVRLVIMIARRYVSR